MLGCEFVVPLASHDHCVQVFQLRPLVLGVETQAAAHLPFRSCSRPLLKACFALSGAASEVTSTIAPLEPGSRGATGCNIIGATLTMPCGDSPINRTRSERNPGASPYNPQFAHS